MQLDFRLSALIVHAGSDQRSAWRVAVQMYDYRLLDSDHRELLAYHWQPESLGPSLPHLHISASLDAQVDALTRGEIDLDKRHLATGHVSLAEVVRMLITEFEVKPLRPDWEARLDLATTH